MGGGFLVMLGIQLAGDSVFGQISAAMQLSGGAWVFLIAMTVTGCALAILLERRGDYERAVYWYRLALECPKTESGFCNPDMQEFIPCMQLCVCLDRLGDRKEAEVYHRRAKAIKPEDRAVQYNERYFASLHASCQEEAQTI